jgi:hypothetical protein
MPIYSFDIAAPAAARLAAAFTDPLGYDWDGVNPPTQVEFVKEKIMDLARERAIKIEGKIRAATRQANAQAITDAEEAAVDNTDFDDMVPA